MKIKIDPIPGHTVEFLEYDIETNAMSIMNARCCNWDDARRESINRRVAIVVREAPFAWAEVERED